MALYWRRKRRATKACQHNPNSSTLPEISLTMQVPDISLEQRAKLTLLLLNLRK